jgi:hypothetical protein
VRTDDARTATVDAILNRYSPIDPVGRGAEYRKQGWSKFDPKQPPYDLSASELERMRRK